MTTVQDDCGGARSNSIFSAGNRIESSAGLRIVTGPEVKDQFSYENDYAPKPRKPYTISKQRERWTEDEHKKFLEALKLFGRSWRMIEEHVGTKTAVQIRSHAQKFFSKVVRESSGCTSGPSEAIEIPPPRPKRKPMHPYPRKLVNPPVKASPNLELSRKSPILMDSAQENQSPTSVLSALGSDAFGSDSNSPNGSLSPDSSAAPVQRCELTLSHPCSSHEESGYPSSVPVTTGSGPLEQSPTTIMRLGVSSQDFAEGVSAMEASSRSLKLFGTIIVVTDSQRPSSRTAGTCKSFPTDANEGKPLQFLSVKVNHAESPRVGTVHSWRQMHRAGPGAICYAQCMDEGSNMGDTDSGAHPPWFSYSCDMPFTVTPYDHPQHSVHSNSNHGGGHDKEFQKEGSWTGSNSKSVNEDNFDKLPDIETQSCQRSLDQEEKGPDLEFELKPSENPAFSVIRTSADKHMKGFVPYKKRMADRDNQAATIIGTEREKQRLRSL